MFIYKITNLINNKIYIGQTRINSSTYYGGGKLIKQAIIKYGIENFKKEILKKGNYSQEVIDNLEKHYISYFDSTNKKIGYNIQKGGFGNKPHIDFTNKYREFCKNRMIGNKIMLGRKRTLDSIQKQSQTQKKKLSLKTKEDKDKTTQKRFKTLENKWDVIGKNISKSKKNKNTGWKNNQSFPVLQLDMNENVIKLWSSSYQAQINNKYNSSHILNVCKGIFGFKTHKKYKWKFATNEDILKYNNLK